MLKNISINVLFSRSFKFGTVVGRLNISPQATMYFPLTVRRKIIKKPIWWFDFSNHIFHRPILHFNMDWVSPLPWYHFFSGGLIFPTTLIWLFHIVCLSLPPFYTHVCWQKWRKKSSYLTQILDPFQNWKCFFETIFWKTFMRRCQKWYNNSIFMQKWSIKFRGDIDAKSVTNEKKEKEWQAQV